MGHLLHVRPPNHLILDAPVVETFLPSERRLNLDDANSSDHLLAFGFVGLLREWVSKNGAL